MLRPAQCARDCRDPGRERTFHDHARSGTTSCPRHRRHRPPVSEQSAAEPQRLRLLLSVADGVDLLQEAGPPLYLRWSADIALDADLPTGLDDLTGIEMPGLAALPLAVEPWWQDRPLELWLARKFGGRRPPVDLDGPAIRPWIVTGTPVGHSPDGETLIASCVLVATVTDAAMTQAASLVESLSHRWAGLGRD